MMLNVNGLKRLYLLRSLINNRLAQLIKLEGEVSVYKKQLDKVDVELLNLSKQQFSLENQKILLKSIYSISKTQIDKIENLCTVALRDILGDMSIQFKIKNEVTKRGIDTYFYVVTESGETDVSFNEAGGIKNILSVCLRLIFMEFCTPKIDGPVILDEVGANISAAYQKNFAEFLRQFSEKNDRQILLVSHITAMQETAPNLITVIKRNKESVIL